MYVIHACATPGSMMWMWVSKEAGMPFTTIKDNARRYTTYNGAVRAMEKLRATAKHWSQVSSACEVYKVEEKPHVPYHTWEHRGVFSFNYKGKEYTDSTLGGLYALASKVGVEIHPYCG